MASSEIIERLVAGSRARRGIPLPPETRAKISASLKAIPEEDRVRQRDAVAAVNRTPAHRAAVSSANRGNRYVLDASIKGECAYCGQPATTRDHIIPVSFGGEDVPENVVLACLTCNASKRGRTPEEWLEAGLYGRDVRDAA